MAAIFPKYPNCPNTSLAACCSFSLPRERGRVAVGIKGSARKISCADCFLFFRRPASTAANPSYFSNCLKPQNPLQSAPSPVGEGWGEGTLQIAAIFPNHLTAPIQALRLVALSLALSHGREDGAAVGVKGSARKIGCAGCLLRGFKLFKTIFNGIAGTPFTIFFRQPFTLVFLADFIIFRK